jgi:hypothetical protein
MRTTLAAVAGNQQHANNQFGILHMGETINA